MTVTPGLRKFVLTAHITSSVGLLGAVVGFLAFNVTALTSQDAQTVRAAYLAMELTILYAIVPLSLASLLIGLAQSLVTPWGLFRHYWVLFKLLLTVLAITILLQYTRTMSYIAGVAAETTLSSAELRELGSSPMLHAVGGLAVLLITTILSVYKPRGMTRYGWRKQQEERARLTQRASAASRPEASRGR